MNIIAVLDILDLATIVHCVRRVNPVIDPWSLASEPYDTALGIWHPDWQFGDDGCAYIVSK